MANPVIEARGVFKRYGEVHAVNGIDLAVEEGEIFGLIGHNGAGKSTLFKMMLGLIPPSAGEIRVGGVPVHGGHFREVRRTIGYLPENVVFYDNLSGLETLHFYADLKGAARSACPALLAEVGLEHAARRRVRTYSKGMRQRLGLAQAILGEPRILFLDEPTTGLDPEGIREFYRVLREMRARDVTIVLTSHILSEIQERVDRLAILRNGSVHALGSVQALREQLDLPLTIEVRAVEGELDALRELLAGCALGEVREADGWLSLQCRRGAKMAAIETLAAQRGRLLDLHLREPSLEDVFLGYSGEAVSSDCQPRTPSP